MRFTGQYVYVCTVSQFYCFNERTFMLLVPLRRFKAWMGYIHYVHSHCVAKVEQIMVNIIEYEGVLVVTVHVNNVAKVLL